MLFGDRSGEEDVPAVDLDLERPEGDALDHDRQHRPLLDVAFDGGDPDGCRYRDDHGDESRADGGRRP